MFIVLAAIALTCGDARAASNDLEGSIYAAARLHGVSARSMLRVAACESTMGLHVHGDNGHSHGPFQLNDRPTGLLHHFYAMGYTKPYDHEQSADYFASVMAGEFPGIKPNRWSCW